MIEPFNHRRDFPGHGRNKQRLMQSSFRACQPCKDREHLGSVMDKRKRLIKHMEVGIMVGTSRIKMTRLEMKISWKHLIDNKVDMDFTLFLFQTGTTVIIAIILIGGVIRDTDRRSSRKKIHLHLIEKCRIHKTQKRGCLE